MPTSTSTQRFWIVSIAFFPSLSTNRGWIFSRWPQRSYCSTRYRPNLCCCPTNRWKWNETFDLDTFEISPVYTLRYPMTASNSFWSVPAIVFLLLPLGLLLFRRLTDVSYSTFCRDLLSALIRLKLLPDMSTWTISGGNLKTESSVVYVFFLNGIHCIKRKLHDRLLVCDHLLLFFGRRQFMVDLVFQYRTRIPRYSWRTVRSDGYVAEHFFRCPWTEINNGRRLQQIWLQIYKSN